MPRGTAIEIWDDLLASEGMPAELPSLFPCMEQLPYAEPSVLDRAGIDEGTPCDTFMQCNGRNTFIGMYSQEGLMASSC